MKALIAMSGGVDSSVAAKFILDQNIECEGASMVLHGDFDPTDAKKVADRLGIPYHVFDYKDEFKEKVIGNFIDCYKRAVTPNPCIVCNKYMKFGRLLEAGREFGCDTIVTGHYVRNEFYDGKYHLLKAADENKDQSYVLYNLTQDLLAHTLFPLGSMTKDKIREEAEKAGFENAHKSDSQDICFVPDGDYTAVIEKYAGKIDRPGKFVDMTGNIMGDHKGITHYTIGQRKGLGLALKAPAYVQKLDVKNNYVILGSNEDLFKTDLTASDVNWISGEIPKEPVNCSAKIRYKHKEQPCRVTVLATDRVAVKFSEPQRAITPGQSVVFYNGDEVLGGGIID